MTSLRYKRPLRLAGGAAAVLLLLGCEDRRLRQLDIGISRDSMVTIVSGGVPARLDTIPNIYKRLSYFVDTKQFDIYLFDSDDRKAWTDPLVEDKELTPIVLIDGRVAGWGWDYMDELTEQYRIEARAVPKS
jgi:hypothetical protein